MLPTKEQVLHQLEKLISQRHQLNPRDYGGNRLALRSDAAQMAADLRHAQELIALARQTESLSAEGIINTDKESPLQWDRGLQDWICSSHAHDARAHVCATLSACLCGRLTLVDVSPSLANTWLSGVRHG